MPKKINVINSHRLISVIIVNFNGADCIIDTIKSILTSDCSVEILIVDNASEDNSVKKLQQHFSTDKRILPLFNIENKGFSVACNQAVLQASGHYLLFLNPDCLIKKETLSQMLEHMGKLNNIGLIGCLIRNRDGTEQAGCRRNTPTPWRSVVRMLHLSKLFKLENVNKHQDALPEQPIDVDAISGAFMLTNTANYKAVGGFDEGYFLHCEDLDLCMRYRLQGFRVVFVPDVEIIHYKGGSSHDRRIRVEYYKHQGMLRYYNKFFKKRYPFFLSWSIYLSVWFRFALLSGYFYVKSRFSIRRVKP